MTLDEVLRRVSADLARVGARAVRQGVLRLAVAKLDRPVPAMDVVRLVKQVTGAGISPTEVLIEMKRRWPEERFRRGLSHRKREERWAYRKERT